MTADDLLSRLESVRRSGRGWQARCPAHEDRSPSLSIREGDHGLLLRCWAGCELSAIVAALGLTVSDLFYDSGLPSHNRRRDQPRPPKRYDFRKAAAEYETHAIGLQLRAESVLSAAQGLPINDWTDDDIEAGFEAVTRAHVDLARAACLESVAFSVRVCGLRKEQERERTRRAA